MGGDVVDGGVGYVVVVYVVDGQRVGAVLDGDDLGSTWSDALSLDSRARSKQVVPDEGDGATCVGVGVWVDIAGVCIVVSTGHALEGLQGAMSFLYGEDVVVGNQL